MQKIEKLLQKKESAVWLGVRKGTLRGQKKKKSFREKNPGSTGIFSLSVAAMNSCRIHTGTAWCIRWSSWRQADIRVIRFIFRS